MSDNSNPSTRRLTDETDPPPYEGGSSASSLGAPTPDPDITTPETQSPETQDPDINGDPDQVT